MLRAPNTPKPHLVIAVVGCAMLFALSGCQHRAYTDLYAESMAGEIRELEDRIYEYDAAYQGIEEELAVLQAENQQLHQKLMAIQTEPAEIGGRGRAFLKGLPGTRSNPSPSPQTIPNQNHSIPSDASIQIVPAPDPIPNTPSKKSTESSTPSVDNLPSPPKNGSAKKESSGMKIDPKDLEVPHYDMGTRSDPVLPPSSIPSPFKSPASPLPTPLPASPASPPPIESIQPPTNTGTQSMNSLEASSLTSNEKTNEADNANPVQLAGAAVTNAFPPSLDHESIDAGRITLPNSIQPAVHHQASPLASEPPRDTKVVEIGFHSTLCRGQYLGANHDGDGIYLVLQPKNASGQTIDIPAAVTVVALDPQQPENASKIGRWTLTRDEVDASLEPIGISHGYHLQLPWQQTKPSGSVVQVYVRYEMEDGRRLVNERRIHLHIPTTGGASWTPRVPK